MAGTEAPGSSWAERAADRSPVVQRSRRRSVAQAKATVEAARRLIEVKGPTFTTQELVREAGIALQTFYRHFPGKDHLLLAVIADIIDESCRRYREEAAALPDPLDRLRHYVTSTVLSLPETGNAPSFITVEHWRLQTLFPSEVAQATRPFTDLLVGEIRQASLEGTLRVAEPEAAAWLVTQLTMAVFHHYDAAGTDEPVEAIADRLWAFCLGGLGGVSPA
ncbi:MAG: TetR/AcrR family transcriptional regulator [Acidimicrobiales bacterium]